jgi:hypothetical protein
MKLKLSLHSETSLLVAGIYPQLHDCKTPDFFGRHQSYVTWQHAARLPANQRGI